VKDFEGLFREGGLNLPANVVKNAFKSIQDGARGWAKDRFSTKTYYCPDGNNKTFNCPKWQLKNQRVETYIEEGYFNTFELNYLKEYLVSSGDQDEETATGNTSTSSTGVEAARGTGEQGNASTAGATSTSTADNETARARGAAAGERGNEATTSTADESNNETAIAVTGMPIAIWHDQISCIRCSLKLTQLMKDGEVERVQDLSAADLSHEGTCYRNSKYSPASAEENAMASLAEYLLVDPKNRKDST
ncbi:hypothetical protein THAOC_23056, partial [Thalassiosira oceanica]